MTEFRYYQQEADDAIYNELLINDKCLVKMFCGTGKSRLMRHCRVAQNKKLVVFVVPSLSLLEQFYTDYLQDIPSKNILRISSEEGSTTEGKDIEKFLKKKRNKIICITYQSFQTLITALNDNKINVCIFDEAHHVVGKTYQPLIFDSNVCEKQIFFTATPKNTMYNKDNESGFLDEGMCGNLVYDYSYFKGAMEGYLNPFEIRIDFYTKNTNASVYKSIARAILASGNSRCLTFHSDVNGEQDTSVLRFVDENAFIIAFNEVVLEEFPEKAGFYTSIKMVALSSKVKSKCKTNSKKTKKCNGNCCRFNILKQFDETPDNEIFIISSCQTIGEGVDTKKANMCDFVDPKSSVNGITQNIGRIVRKLFGQDKPNSTILINGWVDKEKYLCCDGDKDKCDEVIREDINKGGNFNCILNVMSALKQESEDIFDACLNYPSTYSPQEIDGNLSKYGYKLDEPTSLVESLEHMLDTEIGIDEDEEEIDEEILTRVAEENNVVIEVHSNSLEIPIDYYYGQGDESVKEVIRIFRSYDEETEETVYQPITTKDGKKRNTDRVEPLRRENRFNVKVHTNPDVKVLWNLSSDLDLTKDICSCIIDCDVVDMWPQRFEELKAFIDDNERRPLPKNDHEKQLANWVNTQQTHYHSIKYGMKNVIRYDTWTQFLEKYKEYIISNDEKWNQYFEELKVFMNVNEKRPSEVSKNDDEKKLGKWLSQQLNNYKKKIKSMIDANRCSLWTQFLKDYEDYFLNYWFTQLADLKIFIDKHKRLPVTNKEKNLGIWLSSTKQRFKNNDRGMKDEIKRALWIQFLKEYKIYFNTDEEKWLQMFEELKAFMKDNKKRPSEVSKNDDEKKLGQWLSGQMQQYKNKKNGMKYEERYKLWTQFLDNHTKYFTDAWTAKLEELKEFIIINKRRPLRRNINEKKIAGWLSDEHHNYKNKTKGMKDEERYNLWTQFSKEYLDDDATTTKTENDESKEEEFEIIVTPKPNQKKSAKLPKLTKAEANEETRVETTEDIFKRTKPLITQFHNKFCKMRSDNLAQHFKDVPSDFAEYHSVRDECFKTFPPEDIPCNRVIAELNKFKTKKGGKHVIDMGCGTAKISAHFKEDPRFHFTNYDHVAINETVEVCDISRMPLEEDSVDICIMSLALWGSNCEEYVREAFRVLETNGILYIIDSTKRWSDEGFQDGGQLKQMLETNGFTNITSLSLKIENWDDKWCHFSCTKP